jgi:hypothetical protein
VPRRKREEHCLLSTKFNETEFRSYSEGTDRHINNYTPHSDVIQQIKWTEMMHGTI